MQHIPDNEFDRLFKDRLGDAEMQPSANLWDSIAPQIAPKKKRHTGLYWSAAATVLIAVSAGLLFKPQEKIALHAPEVLQSAQSSNTQPLNDTDNTDATSETIYANAERSEIVVAAPVDAPVVSSMDVTAGVKENNDERVQPSEAENHHVITNAVQEPSLAIAQTAPALVQEPSINEAEIDAEEVATTTALEEPASRPQESRTRIRNAGDLVNFVVEKLDKREQKFVEFRTDEDESSSLVAINIGPLKINQRRNNK
jgi:hypothetical protein